MFFNLHPDLGKSSNLTNIFQMGWNHQPVVNDDHLARGDVTKWRTPNKNWGQLSDCRKIIRIFWLANCSNPKIREHFLRVKIKRYSHDGSMGRPVYLPTWMVDSYGFHVGIYTSPMDPKGLKKRTGESLFRWLVGKVLQRETAWFGIPRGDIPSNEIGLKLEF